RGRQRLGTDPVGRALRQRRRGDRPRRLSRARLRAPARVDRRRPGRPCRRDRDLLVAPAVTARRGLAVLALGAFVVAADGTLVVGLLRQIARSLEVSPATAGQALTVFGAVYALGAPLIVRAARAVRPERLAAAALALFAVGNALTAAAPSYAALLGARALAAACAGVFMPTAALVAARAASEERRGRALTVVVGGSSAATALGVPLGTFVGGAVGWRAIFYAVAIAS